MRKLVVIVLVAGCLTLGAEPAEKPTFLEFGGTLGWPAGINFNVGVWTGKSPDLVFRASGIAIPSFGYGWVGGAQVDTGWAFDDEGSFKQFVALSASRMWGNDSSTDTFTIGPTYNFNWNGFAFQIGVGKIVAGRGMSRHEFGPLLQIGFIPLFVR